MTTPVLTQMPPLQVDAEAGNPHTSGLYTAANLLTLTEPTRLEGGTELTERNCGPHGRWSTGCTTDEDNPEQELVAGVRPGRRYQPSFIVWATDDCGLIGNSEQEARERSIQLQRLYEQIDAEDATAEHLLAAAGTPATVPTGADPFADAVGAVEQALGLIGVNGVIHARRGLAAKAARYGLVVVGAGGKLTTPLGNTWAFGAGYGDLGNTIVGTGPVTVRRGTVDTLVVEGHRRNERTAVSQRTINVTWECATVGQAVA